MTDIARQLSGKNAAERAQIKAETHKKALDDALKQSKGKWAFALSDGRRVVVERVGLGVLNAHSDTVAPRKDGGADPVWVRLTVDGQYPNGDGWYGFVNPPVKVPDGTTREATDESGKSMTVANFKEDPEQAFKAMLAQALGGDV